MEEEVTEKIVQYFGRGVNEILCVSDKESGEPKEYIVYEKRGTEDVSDQKMFVTIPMQVGRFADGVNGLCEQDLLNIVLHRLRHWQKSPQTSSRENAIAITEVENALARLMARQMLNGNVEVVATNKV